MTLLTACASVNTIVTERMAAIAVIEGRVAIGALPGRSISIGIR
jgi:hypothetical protein